MPGSVFCGGRILCDIAGNANNVSTNRSTSVAGICHAGTACSVTAHQIP
jgi:hypothetical protein